MEQRLEEFLEKESARLGIRISSRQPMEAQLRQYVRHMSPAYTTDDEVNVVMALLMLQFQEQPRMVTRSMMRS